MNADEVLADWQAKADAATDAPWTFTAVMHSQAMGVGIPYVESGTGWPAMCLRSQDAAFIAASREAVPALIAALRAVRSLLPVAPHPETPTCEHDLIWEAAQHSLGQEVEAAITSALDGPR